MLGLLFWRMLADLALGRYIAVRWIKCVTVLYAHLGSGIVKTQKRVQMVRHILLPEAHIC